MTCPKCLKGKMVFTGEGFMSLPEKWFHLCNVCNHFQTYTEKYST